MDLSRSKFTWFDNENIRPYVFVREDMRIQDPGSRFPMDIFPKDPIWFNPLYVDEVSYANLILNLENKAFGKSGMAMPRWVFYDCAIMPGFVAGFAQKTETLSDEVKKALGVDPDRKWTPISLFVIIPTMNEGEWFAHNLCSVNSLLPRDKKFYGLGFITKAFGLWYANIETCCGATQWGSPAVKLHSQYGPFEILTAWTPAHDYANTITYKMNVDADYWNGFITKEDIADFDSLYEKSGLSVTPDNEEEMKALQKEIESGAGPFYFNPNQVRAKSIKDSLDIYKKRS